MASAANDREKALDAALAQIERQFGKGSVMRLGEEGRIPIDVIPTGSIALAIAWSVKAASPPAACTLAIAWSARVVLPEDSGP